jgi:hypothetical protein
MVALLGHDFPITYNESEEPQWQTPLGLQFQLQFDILK